MKDEPPHISADVLDSISADTAWILLWVRRPDLRPSVEVLKTFAGRVESWKRVLEIAHQNDLGQLLASNLRGMAWDEIGVPTWVAQELDQRRQVCLARSAQVVFHLAPILKDLDQEGVPTMVLKGALLAETLYPDPGARSFFDVDLLVAPEHFPGAYRTLMRRGYVALCPFDFSNPPLVGHYLNSILCRGTAPQSPLIHLHWHLVTPACPRTTMSIEFPWKRFGTRLRSWNCGMPLCWLPSPTTCWFSWPSMPIVRASEN